MEPNLTTIDSSTPETASPPQQDLPKSRKNDWIRWTILAVICIVGIGFGGYYLRNRFQFVINKPTVNPTPSPTVDFPLTSTLSSTMSTTTCKNFNTVSDILKTSLAGNYKLTARDESIINTIGFYWRRNASEPMISYPAQKKRILFLYTQSSDSTAKLLEEKAVPSLASAQLIKNILNFASYSKSSVTQGGGSSYGFLNGKDYYVITVDGGYSTDTIWNEDGSVTQEVQLPENSSGVEISCGFAEPMFDEIYNKIIKTGIYGTKDKIGIAQLTDGIVYLNVSEVNGFGGFASYWLIRGSQVEQLIKGTQENPPCAIFESKKTGNGLDCYDAKTEESRKVHYQTVNPIRYNTYPLPSGWTTCTNTSADYQIDYPSAVAFDSNTCNYAITDFEQVKNITVTTAIDDFRKNWLFSIKMDSSPLSVKEWVNNNNLCPTNLCTNNSSNSELYNFDVHSHYVEKDYVMKLGDTIVRFILNARNPDVSPNTGVKDIFYQMVSSFSFSQ